MERKVEGKTITKRAKSLSARKNADTNFRASGKVQNPKSDFFLQLFLARFFFNYLFLTIESD